MGPQSQSGPGKSNIQRAKIDFEDWLYGAVDMLASEYGWGFRDILYKVYPEDFFLLQRQIKMRHIDNYLMEASIIANPYKSADDAKEFIESLMKERRWYRGDPDQEAALDVGAFERFREQMKQDSHLIKAK